MTSQPDHYAVLGVKPAASQQEISRAYRALMRTHHPDVDGLKAAERGGRNGELLRIMQAFSVLRDPAKRAAYDRSRTALDTPGTNATNIPAHKVRSRNQSSGPTIRITPVRWESGPWA